MKRILCHILAIASLTLSGTALAVPVSYDVGPYAAGGYSASWLHAATGCDGTGPSGSTLYMCGDADALTGTLSGDYDSGVLTITGGEFTVGSNTYSISGGSLGGAFVYNSGGYHSNWYIVVDGMGTFYFEGLDMGSGMPNAITMDELILWGQNLAVYLNGDCNDCTPWAVDLYGRSGAVSVPEPGTLALLAAGLLGMALMQRRRKVAYASRT